MAHSDDNAGRKGSCMGAGAKDSQGWHCRAVDDKRGQHEAATWQLRGRCHGAADDRGSGLDTVKGGRRGKEEEAEDAWQLRGRWGLQ